MKRDQPGKSIPRSPEQSPSPLANAVAGATAKFEGANLSPEALRELSRNMHYSHPEARGCEPEEQRLAAQSFCDKIAACRDVLKRFQDTVAPERESEAIAIVIEFVDMAFGALVTINWNEFDRQLINLSYAANRLSQPPPPKPFDQWMRVAIAIGWDADEREMIATDLLRDNSIITAIDVHGFATSSGRRVERVDLRNSWAPREEPWRTRFYERLPRIPGDAR
jgi:hypothetical protein